MLKIILFKGKIKFKTFDCSLPKKQGIKLYCLADCDAYALNCKLYGQNEYLDMTGMLDLDATENILKSIFALFCFERHFFVLSDIFMRFGNITRMRKYRISKYYLGRK